jgi:hypothetical protein
MPRSAKSCHQLPAAVETALRVDDEKPKQLRFGKGVITDEVAAAIEAPLPAETLDAMLNGPLDPGADK